MLTIYLYTDKGKRALNMLADTEITLKDVAPEFNDKLDNGFYSLPIDIPMSGENRHLLQMPENNASGLPVPVWDVDLFEDGIPIYSKVKMILLKYSSQVNFDYGVYHMSLTGAISRFAANSDGKSLKDLQLGGRIKWADQYDSRTFANLVMKPDGQYSYYRDRLGFAPVYWPGFIDESREDFSTEVLNYNTVNSLWLQPNTNDWFFQGEDYNNANQPFGPWQPEYADYKTVPFFRLRFVLEQLFSEFGYTVHGSLLQDEDFNKIYLPNNYSIERCVHQNHTDYNRIINPQNHVPDITITDFLVAVCANFGVCLSFDENTVQLNYVQDAILKDIIEVTEISDDEIEGTFPDSDKTGYDIDWTFGTGDNAPGDYVLEINKDDVIFAVNSHADMMVITGNNDGDLLYCRDENWYYRWDEPGQKWKYFSEGQQNYTSGHSNTKLSLKMSPLLQAKGRDDDDNNFSKNMLMAQGAGCYYNDAYKQVQNDFGLRMMFIDLLPIPGNSSYVVPTTYNHNTDDAGNRRSRFGLNLKQDKGLVKTFKERWLSMTDRSIYIDAQIKLPPNITPSVLIGKRIKLVNRYYLPKEYECKKGKDSYFKITLMQI